MEEKYATIKELSEVKSDIKSEYKEVIKEVKALREEFAAFTAAMQERVAVIETTCALRKEVIESIQEDNKTRQGRSWAVVLLGLSSLINFVMGIIIFLLKTGHTG